MIGILLLTTIAALPDSSCVVCHSELREAYTKSVHTAAGVGCTACHGGVVQTLDMKKAHSGDFRKTPTRREIPTLCNDCHSDPDRMRPYGLPIDQMLYYRASEHGKAWLRGEDRTAVCTDCHGTHDILRVDDPRSPLAPERVPETCGRCHGNPELMRRYGLSASIPERYRASIHFQRVQEGYPNAPTCVTCHTGHGAAPPGVMHIEELCGKCHPQTARAFRLSPHEKAFAEEAFPFCSTCHGTHETRRFNAQTFLESCENCHTRGEEAIRVGEDIQTLFLRAEEALNAAEQALQEALRQGVLVTDLQEHLADGRSYLVAAYPLSHSLALDTLQATLRKARSLAEDVVGEVQARSGRRREAAIVLSLLWFYVLLTLGVAEWYRRSQGSEKE